MGENARHSAINSCHTLNSVAIGLPLDAQHLPFEHVLVDGLGAVPEPVDERFAYEVVLRTLRPFGDGDADSDIQDAVGIGNAVDNYEENLFHPRNAPCFRSSPTSADASSERGVAPFLRQSAAAVPAAAD